jgi:hypothetical protein
MDLYSLYSLMPLHSSLAKNLASILYQQAILLPVFAGLEVAAVQLPE